MMSRDFWTDDHKLSSNVGISCLFQCECSLEYKLDTTFFHINNKPCTPFSFIVCCELHVCVCACVVLLSVTHAASSSPIELRVKVFFTHLFVYISSPRLIYTQGYWQMVYISRDCPFCYLYFLEAKEAKIVI